MGAINSSRGRAWLAPQTAKGTAQAASHASVREFSWVGGAMPDVTKTSAEQRALDGKRQSPRSRPVVTAIDANGNPRFQCVIADLIWLIKYGLGYSDTVTTNGDQFDHELEIDENGTGARLTSWFSLGGPDTADSPAPIRQMVRDNKITSIGVASTAQDPFLVITLGIEGLHGETFVTLPTASLGATVDQVTHFDINGSFTVDGTVLPVSSINLTMDFPHAKWRGDLREGRELVEGAAMVKVSFSTLLDERGKDMMDLTLYGMVNPPAGTSASDRVYHSDVTWTWTQPDSEESATFLLPNVYFEATAAPEGNPNGEPIELAFTGDARDSDTQSAVVINATLNEGAFVLPTA